MNTFLQKMLDWSEVWALLAPLAVFLNRRQQPAHLKPVILYLWLALLIDIAIDVIVELNTYYKAFPYSNNPLYNLHSVVRFSCFAVFFLKIPQVHFLAIRKLLVGLFFAFLLINFSLFENFFNREYFSGNLLTVESYLLLIYCMLYYLSELRDEKDWIFKGPDFWIVTGLAIYVVINFFVFLFYVPMTSTDPGLSTNMWNVHNIAFIIFCIFMTKAFYATAGNKYSS